MTNSQSTKANIQKKFTKIEKSQDKQRKFFQQINAILSVVLAVCIVVQGNLDVLSGKPVLGVIQGMIAQGIELIIKAQRTEAHLKETERKLR